MDIWDILGIEQTKDKNLLKTAYRAKLKSVNPEDDPDGFMRLREAYEEAVRLADADEEPVEESELVKSLRSLYSSYSRRIDVGEWEEIFDRDEFVALDTSQESLDTLIRFLMEKFFIPKEVWKLIVDRFDIISRRKELSEVYTENFIEYMINNSIYDDVLDYSLLECKDELVDKFLDRYFKLDIAIRKHDYKEQKEYIRILEDIDAYHPYFEMLKLKAKIQEHENVDVDKETEEEREERKNIYQDIYQDALLLHSDFPEDINLMGLCGDLKLLLGDYEEAGEYYDKALEIKPDNYVLKGKLAEQKLCIGEYVKSRDLFMELLKTNHYDNSARAGMIRANTELIKELKGKAAKEPDNKKHPMEMGWSYYQIYKFDEALKVLDELEPDESQIFEYNNLKGRVYLCLQDFNNALKCFSNWKDAIEAIPKEDDSKDAKDKRKRYGYVNCLIGDCYLKLQDYKTAEYYLKTAYSIEHEEIVLTYEALCELEYKTENYEKCIEYCTELIEKEKTSFVAYNYMSKASLRLDYIKEAMDASQRAMDIYPYIAEPYETQIGVYLRFNQIDGAKAIVEKYNKLGLDSDRIKLCQAKIFIAEEKYREALNDLEYILMGTDKDASDLEDKVKVHDLRGYCLEMLGDVDMALRVYEDIAKNIPNHPSVHRRIGLILKKQGKLAKALEMFSKQIEISPEAMDYVNRGTLNRFFQKYKSALADFEEALKLEPDDAFCYSRIGLIYEAHREFDKAIENYDMALQYVTEDSGRLQLYTYKARTMQCLNRFEAAMELYNKYIEEFGLNPDIAYDISELAVRMGNVDYATKLLEDCINKYEYDDNVKNCVVQLISIYGTEGYLSRAYETVQFAVTRFGKHAEFFAAMGAVLRDMGLYEAAAGHYHTAVKLDIDCKQNYYSELIEVLKKKNPLRQDLKKYVEKAMINPAEMTNPHAYIKMSRLNRTLKKYKEALSIIDKGLQIKRCMGCFYGSCHDAYYEKGLIYEAMRDYVNARLCYRQALAICGHNALYEECLKRIEGK